MAGAPSSDSRPWYEREPERLAWEIECLAEIGLDAEQGSDGAELTLTVEVPHAGQRLRTVIRFPSGYPQIAPTVFAPKGVLERHQQPSTDNLCLLDVESQDWTPEHSCAFLIERFQQLLLADAFGEEAVAAGEADMAEPLTRHLSTKENSLVILSEGALARKLGSEKGRFVLKEIRPGAFAMWRLRANASTGGNRIIAETDARQLGLLKATGEKVSGNWFECADPPTPSRIDELRQAAKNTIVPGSDGRKIVGVTFFEEGPTRDKTRRAWAFYEFSPEQPEGVALETQALSREVRSLRIPELKGLEEQSVLVVGGGSLGGQLVLELAKAGVGEINVVDDDRYDLNNSVRHILPASVAGYPKAQAVAEAASAINPLVTVNSHSWPVGKLPSLDAELAGVIEGSSLVIDATGVQPVTRFLHRLVSAAGKELLVVNLTPGAYGGRIVRLKGRSPCYDCFKRHTADGTIQDAPMQPVVPGVTPYGCSHPAASGAGFDAAELVAVAARRAVQELNTNGYPASDTDWIILSFRDAPAEKRYREGELTVHHDCPYCGAGET